jgi:2-polyprenyl-3-methyl-5-hydroxy-6-metoxy-1,4-benzoquinol methylase
MSKGDPVVSTCSFSPGKWATIPVRVITRAFPRLNAASWDLQYKLGLWDHLDLTQSTGFELFQMIEEYAPMASILDLGCGTTANLPFTPGRFRHYHGVDISEKAIGRARQLGRTSATYETADILTYVPQEAYDVILLREVIYYLPLAKVGQLLRRLSAFLTPNGVILIQIWAGAKNSGLLGAMKASALPVTLEKTLGPGPGHPTVYLLGKPENRAGTLDSRAS